MLKLYSPPDFSPDPIYLIQQKSNVYRLFFLTTCTQRPRVRAGADYGTRSYPTRQTHAARRGARTPESPAIACTRC